MNKYENPQKKSFEHESKRKFPRCRLRSRREQQVMKDVIQREGRIQGGETVGGQSGNILGRRRKRRRIILKCLHLYMYA
jgi:hypothetical protein